LIRTDGDAHARSLSMIVNVEPVLSQAVSLSQRSLISKTLDIAEDGQVSIVAEHFIASLGSIGPVGGCLSKTRRRLRGALPREYPAKAAGGRSPVDGVELVTAQP
jgi:hypothetical protein